MKSPHSYLSALCILTISFSLFAKEQPTDQKAALNLSKEQHQKLDSANKAKASTVKSLRDQEESSIDQVRQKVDAMAPDAEIVTVFTEVKSAMKSLQSTENAYWETLTMFLTPTQQAKIFLKSHPPKNPVPPAATPAPAPKPGAAPQQQYGNPPQDWKPYFGLTKDQQQKFDAANKTKSTALKPLHESQDAAIDALRQKVDAGAPDSDIAAAFSSVKAILKAIQDDETAYWDGLAGFLTPTQQAKLFLKGKPKK
jgi:Spy/CpxP family protein refolding chaperone